MVGGTSAGGRRETADEDGAAEWTRSRAAGALKRCCCCGRAGEKLVHDGMRVRACSFPMCDALKLLMALVICF